jgi:hypothetical protein
MRWALDTNMAPFFKSLIGFAFAEADRAGAVKEDL